MEIASMKTWSFRGRTMKDSKRKIKYNTVIDNTFKSLQTTQTSPKSYQVILTCNVVARLVYSLIFPKLTKFQEVRNIQGIKYYEVIHAFSNKVTFWTCDFIPWRDVCVHFTDESLKIMIYKQKKFPVRICLNEENQKNHVTEARASRSIFRRKSHEIEKDQKLN